MKDNGNRLGYPKYLMAYLSNSRRFRYQTRGGNYDYSLKGKLLNISHIPDVIDMRVKNRSEYERRGR
jgi:hypothetical protein